MWKKEPMPRVGIALQLIVLDELKRHGRWTDRRRLMFECGEFATGWKP